MLDYLNKVNKGRYFDKNEVFDKAIQASRLPFANVVMSIIR